MALREEETGHNGAGQVAGGNDQQRPGSSRLESTQSGFSTEGPVVMEDSTAVLSPVLDSASTSSAASAREPSRYAKHVPAPIRRWSKAVANWVKGPKPPRTFKISPLFPQIQHAPLRLLERYAPKKRHRALLLLILYVVWLVPFAAVLHESITAASVPGLARQRPIFIGCTAAFWSDFNECGTNGDDCRPFDGGSIAFRCPAGCLSTTLLNDHAVGTQEINYEPLVVGGPTDAALSIDSSVYRGDSFICAAAIHSGYISNSKGGCGAVRRIGQQTNFPALTSNGITSTGFDSYFPLSFSFTEASAGKCQDLRWPLLGVTLTCTILLSLFTTSPGVFFWSTFVGLFFHVALASDPKTSNNFYDILSWALGGFLPAAFCAFVIYRFSVIRQLEGLTAQVEKTVLWLGACWAGALNNYTFDKIPLSRLTPHDLNQQPGAIVALIIIVGILLVIALGQIWCLRIEGRLPRFLALYGIFVVALLLCVAVPNMSLRIHHYILALLLLPGTAIQTRPSLIYQGILVGLFLNGIARWGFDSILQTDGELLGDAKLGTPLPHIKSPPLINANTNVDGLQPNITLEWSKTLPRGYDGLSILINDVERYRGFADGDSGEFGSFTWERHVEGLPEYFRFGFLSGSDDGDYTRAGTWGKDLDWVPMADGPS